MKNSKAIALCAISAAFSVVFLALGAFIEVIDIACVMFAGIALMLPLSKKLHLGAFLSYIASFLLGLLFTGARFTVLIPFAVFFGLYPIVNSLQIKYKVNKILALIIKDVWFLLAMFVYYKVLVAFANYDIINDFAIVPDKFKGFIAPALFILGAVFFVFYDSVMFKVQISVNYLVEKLKL